MSSDAEHADDQTEDQTEAAAQATKGAKGAQAAQAAQEAAPARKAQGGRAQGTVVADIRLDDPDVVQAVTSIDGKMRITREDLKNGLTADQAQLLWDCAMHEHTRCETARLVTKRFISDLETIVAQRGDELLGANRRVVVPPPPNVPANPSDAANLKDDFLYLQPIRDAMDLNDAPYIVPHGTARWQRKLIAASSIHENRIAQKYKIRFVEDTHTRDGKPYSVNTVTKASYCGAFPHALLFPSVKPRKGIPTYTCSAGLDVVLTIQLESANPIADGQSPTIVTEKNVLADLRSVLDPREVAAFGKYECSMIFYVELQFAPEEDDLSHSIDDPDQWVCADSSDHDHRAFELAPPDRRLLLPYETRPYAGGYYECAMKNGRCEFQFAFNQHVVSKNLHHTKKDRLFRFAVWCLNPYLNGLTESFACVSSPFQIKSTLHNDLGRLDRYYANDKGEHVRVDPSAVTRLAPARSCSVAKRAVGTKRALGDSVTT